MFLFKRFSIKFCIWKSNRFFFYWFGVTPKNWPTVKKRVYERNVDFLKFGSNLTSDLLIFVYRSIFYLKKSIFAAKIDFLINFIRILWFIRNLLLVLCYSHKDVVSWTLLRHKNIWTFFTWQPQMLN